jgi:signal peptidase I
MKTAEIHTSHDDETKPALFSKKGGELKLSGPALVELLKDVLDKGVPFRLRVKGFSMTPFVKDGDVITVSPLSGTLPRLGDVVAFIHPKTERLVVHRMVGQNGNYFLISGDNTSSVTNDLIPKENILGYTIKVEREGNEVFLGLGPERFLIAFLTRIGLLSHLLTPLWKLVRPFVKRMAP